MVKHAFSDPQAYVKNVIAIMMDESTGRDNLINIIKEFNKKTPFVVLNDYRIAYATNSLRRVEILKNLILKWSKTKAELWRNNILFVWENE